MPDATVTPALLHRTVGAVIAGEERLGGGPAFAVLDPSTGREIAAVEASTCVDDAVAAGRAAVDGAWGALVPAERGAALHRVGAIIRARRDELALLEAMDAGLPLSLARADVDVAARYFEYYAGAADKLTGDTIPLGPGVVDFTLREPWGVCAIVQPFNFPFQLFARSVAPALATGNAAVVKSADAAPLTSVALARIAVEAGVAPGALSVVHGGADVGAALVAHAGVDHVTFTGSTATGRKIMEACARTITPLTLELGGKSPQIVLDAGLVEPAAAAIARSLFRTSGQACSAGSRALVPAGLRERLVERVVAHGEALAVGPALDDPDMGPLISERQLERALGAVAGAVERGAELRCGGVRLDDATLARGFFVGPTVLSGVDPGAPIAQEETFAPVLTVTDVADAEEALAVANATPYGLAAGVWSRDLGVALRAARRLQAGQVFVNGYGGGVELPFGGYKRSGFGREKGLEALREYTQVKNVHISMADR